MKKTLLFALSLLIIITAVSCAPRMTILPPKANTTDITYDGRFEFTSTGAKFDWPLSSISAGFTGKQVAVLMNANGNEFNVYVDGTFREVVTEFPYSVQFPDSAGTTHTIRVEKRNEVWGTPAEFTGILIPDNQKFVPLPPKKHKILVVGDSISAGYGDEGPGLTCDNVRKYTNPALAYAALTANNLDASIHLIAVSGRGVIRNYAEPLSRSAEPLPVVFPRTLFNDPSSVWDMTKYVPDIIISNLGTNDFSTEPKPEQDTFRREYFYFGKKLRDAYPDAQMFVICGPMTTPPQCTAIQEAVESAKMRKDKKVHYVTFPGQPMENLGCDWHPNTTAHKLLSDNLTEEIKGVLEKAAPKEASAPAVPLATPTPEALALPKI